ncbi:MAG: diphthine--ammonia ligase [Candidatus Omnitrophota bacterium]|nr:diphthine--ammonia ligase [Candidatus Omnitrophota bacterium]
MFQNHGKAFVSWSGGKDSTLAYYNAIKNDKVKVAYLLNMLSENGTHSRSHHLSVAMLKAQAEAMGIPIMQRQATWGGYEEEFKKALTFFKKEGVQAGVFGDIDVQEHRDWVERVCSESGLNAILPLWQRSRESLMGEFIACGFKAVIVAVKLECMGSEWLGRQLDAEFVRDIKRLPQVDLCGENGEYHTFVYDGPIFKKPVEFTTGEKVLKDNHWFLNLFSR